MTEHEPGDGARPYFCVDAEHAAPWLCSQEWVFEPDLGEFKVFVCDDHGTVTVTVSAIIDLH